MSNQPIKTDDYRVFIQDVKQRIQTAQIKAAITVNEALLRLYWDIAASIVAKQQESAWGDGFLTQISRDLQGEFPQMKGFSLRNIKYMRQWYQFWSAAENAIGQQLVAQIPWGHNLVIISKAHDRVENALVEHVSRFLLELGAGFSFLGRQYKLTVDDDDFYIDLLFYHVRLHCYVVVELKADKFKPEFAGKLNFYVSAVDGLLRSEADQPTIGILICKSKKKTVVEYAMKDLHKPIGVSEYQLTRILPDEFQPSLPSIEAFEAELEGYDE